MKFAKIILSGILCSISFTVNAEDKSSGKNWQQDNSDKFLKLCIVSAVNKNMKYLVNKKVVTLGSDKYNSILKKVRDHQALVCQCTQDSIRENTSFLNIAKKCNEQALEAKKSKS